VPYCFLQLSINSFNPLPSVSAAKQFAHALALSRGQDLVMGKITTFARRLVLKVVAHRASSLHKLACTGDADTLFRGGIGFHLRHCCPPIFLGIKEL
jgi:hypothetical protein